jgi:hypothetical protein
MGMKKAVNNEKANVVSGFGMNWSKWMESQQGLGYPVDGLKNPPQAKPDGVVSVLEGIGNLKSLVDCS